MHIESLNPEGILEVEKEAHAKIEPALPNHWQGYASLELLDRRYGSSEIDLVIVNDFQILLVEFKRLHGKLTSDGQYWYKNGQRLYSNPVNLTNLKAKKLASRIKDKLGHKLSHMPFVNFCVVLYGSADKSGLTEEERDFVILLDDFLTIGTQGRYDKFFPLRSHEKNLSKDKRPTSHLKLWNNFFCKNKHDFVGRELGAQNYVVSGSPLFIHPDQIYEEYFSQRRDDKNYKALLRRWNFHAAKIATHAKTSDERALIAHRESKVLGYIDNCDEHLEALHLRPLYIQDELTADFIELYQWPKNRTRIEEFLLKLGEKLGSQERLDLIQVLVSQVARLHSIRVAHRDIGKHSIWLSLPSRVTFSNFVTASYPDPDQKTMVSIRTILQAGQAKMPEDLFSDEDGTQFTRDVYLTAAAAHFIAFRTWPNRDSDNLYVWHEPDADPFGGKLNDWFSKCLDLEASQRFQNMEEALDALNNAVGVMSQGSAKASSINEAFLTETNVWTDYPGNIVGQKGTCLLIKTADEKHGIKLWNGVSTVSGDAPNLKLSVFLQRIQSIASAAIPILPRIEEFGVNASLANLFVAYEWINGATLKEWDVRGSNNAEALKFIHKLLIGIQAIHQNHIFHGDIHPENIIVTGTEPPLPRLIDVFEYVEGEQPPYNREYLPDNFENLGIEARDRFAVIKIAKELADQVNAPNLSIHADELLKQGEIGDGDIDRLVADFDNIANPIVTPPLACFDVTLERMRDEMEEMLSDDGNYFVTVKTGSPGADSEFFLKIYLCGVRHQIDLHVDPESKKILRAWFKDIQHSQFIRSKREASFEFEGRIRATRGLSNDAEPLVELILQHEVTRKLIRDCRPDLGKKYREVLGLAKGRSFDVKRLWRVLLETEQESLPKVTLQKDPEILPNGDIVVEYSADAQAPDCDLRNDIVIMKKSMYGRLHPVGRILELGRNAIRLSKTAHINKLRAGDEVALESRRSSASLTKRLKAMEAVLSGRSLIPALPDYFDPNNTLVPSKMLNPPNDAELDQYDESDSDGNIVFSLNTQQRAAFRALVENGPVSLLQGPPGTGKTAFISSFVHYAISSGATRILLVSQSHEAVNNAAEKVRGIFDSKEQRVAVVRLGDEDHASDALKDVHELSLQEHYREKFRAEFKVRLKSSARQIGLPDEFIDTAIEFEKGFGESIQMLSRAKQSKEAPENLLDRIQRLNKDLASFLSRTMPFGFENDADPTDIKDRFYRVLANSTGVTSPRLVEKFRQLANLASEWLTVMSSGSANFQNFLAKTRTLVCGTCVGIGRTHYGITENTYDWVVIDEAARASASELAIAMLVGRRLLLVGDHKQLGAIYEEDHLKAAKRILRSLSEEDIVKSDFERAFVSSYGNQVGQTLTTQYRMAPPIGSMVSHCFYKNQLQNGRKGPAKWVEELPSSLGTTVTWIDTTDKGHGAFEASPNRDDMSHSKHNAYEIRVIGTLLRNITSSDSFLDQFGEEACIDSPIGVICMYKEQKQEMIRHLNSATWSRELIEKRRVKIDTVDSYQGKENSIVVVSLVRNNRDLKLGYLSEGEPSALQRSNVAISRAKERLYLIGATRMFTDKNKKSPIGEILDYMRSNQSGDLTFIASTEVGGR